MWFCGMREDVLLRKKLMNLKSSSGPSMRIRDLHGGYEIHKAWRTTFGGVENYFLDAEILEFKQLRCAIRYLEVEVIA